MWLHICSFNIHIVKTVRKKIFYSFCLEICFDVLDHLFSSKLQLPVPRYMQVNDPCAMLEHQLYVKLLKIGNFKNQILLLYRCIKISTNFKKSSD